MDKQAITCDTKTERNREQINNIQPIVAPNPKEEQGTSPAESPILLRREIPMAWGTTTDNFNSKNQSFPICNGNKMSNTKGSNLVPYSGRLK